VTCRLHEERRRNEVKACGSHGIGVTRANEQRNKVQTVGGNPCRCTMERLGRSRARRARGVAGMVAGKRRGRLKEWARRTGGEGGRRGYEWVHSLRRRKGAREGRGRGGRVTAPTASLHRWGVGTAPQKRTYVLGTIV
jgi:hypothetical protein